MTYHSEKQYRANLTNAARDEPVFRFCKDNSENLWLFIKLSCTFDSVKKTKFPISGTLLQNMPHTNSPAITQSLATLPKYLLAFYGLLFAFQAAAFPIQPKPVVFSGLNAFVTASLQAEPRNQFLTNDTLQQSIWEFAPGKRYLLALLSITTGLLLISLIYLIHSVYQHKKTHKQLKLAQTDLTESRAEIAQAIEKARDADKVTENFMYSMTHELRTPLNGIIGFAEILQEESSAEEHRNMAGTIFQSAQRLLNTINSILDLSDIEATRLEINLTDFNLPGIIKRCIAEKMHDAEEKNLRFIYDPETNLLTIRSDESHIVTILNKLIENAIKYTDTGYIKISLGQVEKRGRNWAVLKVADSGPGIPEDRLGLIFANFRQASEGFNRKHEGSGIGLSLARNLISILGGHIEVQSTVGKGSVFTVYIPATRTPDDIAVHSPFIQSNAGIRKPALLLVEDEETNREFVIYTLQPYFEIDLALDGKTALNMATKKDYRLILLDINLGTELSGIDIIQWLRRQPQYLTTPIAAVTANAQKIQREKLMQAGFSHYLAKPFTRSELKALVRNMAGENPFGGNL
jgi:signal transduction histidine kinase/ActR/RegA family two-component response regulator